MDFSIILIILSCLIIFITGILVGRANPKKADKLVEILEEIKEKIKEKESK